MFVLRKTTNDEKLLAILERRYKENQANPKKMSGLAARMQALQQMQQEQMKQQNFKDPNFKDPNFRTTRS